MNCIPCLMSTPSVKYDDSSAGGVATTTPCAAIVAVACECEPPVETASSESADRMHSAPDDDTPVVLRKRRTALTRHGSYIQSRPATDIEVIARVLHLCTNGEPLDVAMAKLRQRRAALGIFDMDANNITSQMAPRTPPTPRSPSC